MLLEIQLNKVVTKPATSIPRQPGLRSAVCSFRRAEICTRPRARLSANGQNRKPKDWLAPGHPARPNGTPLHSAQFAAPFRQPSFVTPQN